VRKNTNLLTITRFFIAADYDLNYISEVEVRIRRIGDGAPNFSAELFFGLPASLALKGDWQGWVSLEEGDRGTGGDSQFIDAFSEEE